MSSEQRWRPRPVLARLVRLTVLLGPILAGTFAATLMVNALPAPSSDGEMVGMWAVLAVVATAVTVVADRAARRLLPLSALLRLSMLFPDRAPSRFRIARQAASVGGLERRIARAEHPLASGGEEVEGVQDAAWTAETVLVLISALGRHDKRTRGHSERVHVYAEMLAMELDLDEVDRDKLRWAALLHDVGKLVVDSEVLNKPGRPDAEQWELLRRHPEAGAKLCAPLLPWLGEWGHAIDQHHERWDGSGYPAQLAGTDIARSARIVSVADCFEVMTTARTYSTAMSAAEAREDLVRCAGTQFDPAMVRAFLNISVGRLRAAMGVSALLGPLPGMVRLASRFEPLTRVAVVMAGTAVLVGGVGGLAPSRAERAAAPSIAHEAGSPALVLPLGEERSGPGTTGSDPQESGGAGPAGGEPAADSEDVDGGSAEVAEVAEAEPAPLPPPLPEGPAAAPAPPAQPRSGGTRLGTANEGQGQVTAAPRGVGAVAPRSGGGQAGTPGGTGRAPDGGRGGVEARPVAVAPPVLEVPPSVEPANPPNAVAPPVLPVPAVEVPANPPTDPQPGGRTPAPRPDGRTPAPEPPSGDPGPQPPTLSPPIIPPPVVSPPAADPGVQPPVVEPPRIIAPRPEPPPVVPPSVPLPDPVRSVPPRPAPACPDRSGLTDDDDDDGALPCGDEGGGRDDGGRHDDDDDGGGGGGEGADDDDGGDDDDGDDGDGDDGRRDDEADGGDDEDGRRDDEADDDDDEDGRRDDDEADGGDDEDGRRDDDDEDDEDD